MELVFAVCAGAILGGVAYHAKSMSSAQPPASHWQLLALQESMSAPQDFLAQVARMKLVHTIAGVMAYVSEDLAGAFKAGVVGSVKLKRRAP